MHKNALFSNKTLKLRGKLYSLVENMPRNLEEKKGGRERERER